VRSACRTFGGRCRPGPASAAAGGEIVPLSRAILVLECRICDRRLRLRAIRRSCFCCASPASVTPDRFGPGRHAARAPGTSMARSA
jgi:hypothetical protein